MTSDAPDENDSGGGIAQCACGFDGPLEILSEAGISVDPCEGPVDNTSSGIADEPSLLDEFAYDLDRDRGRIPGAIAIVGAVGISALNEGCLWRDCVSRGAAPSRA